MLSRYTGAAGNQGAALCVMRALRWSSVPHLRLPPRAAVDRRKVRAVEIWGKQRAERGVLLPWYYYFCGEEIAETKGEDFLRACRFEKWEADRAASCCALPVRNIELHMVLVSTYTDGPSAFRYQRAHKVRKKIWYRYDFRYQWVLIFLPLVAGTPALQFRLEAVISRSICFRFSLV